MIICVTCGAENRSGSAVCRMCSNLLGPEDRVSPAFKEEAAVVRTRVVSTSEKAGLRDRAEGPQRGQSPGMLSEMVSCPNCGQRVGVASQYCFRCGAAVQSDQTLSMASVKPVVRARLVLVVEGEQTTDEFPLECETVIGRKTGDMVFPHDDYMSGRHARIVKRGGSYFLSDEGSRNGTFVRIDGEIELRPGDMLLVGKQLFRFEV